MEVTPVFPVLLGKRKIREIELSFFFLSFFWACPGVWTNVTCLLLCVCVHSRQVHMWWCVLRKKWNLIWRQSFMQHLPSCFLHHTGCCREVFFCFLFFFIKANLSFIIQVFLTTNMVYFRGTGTYSAFQSQLSSFRVLFRIALFA